MEKTCIKFKNVKKDGEKMRPGTPSPDMHWAWMLQSQYVGRGVHVVYTDQGPQLCISKQFSKDEDGFSHLMDFIRQHNITYTIDETECERCDGHPQCLHVKP